ncbi:MAG: hypothetical protein ACK4GQ_05350, partial [Candidatus Hadarchaeales archaeon]
MPCDFFSAGGESILKISCRGCSKGGAIETSQDCMQHVLKALMETPNIDTVILSDAYDREYQGEALKCLKNLAKILKEWKIWGQQHLTVDGCSRCLVPRKSRLERIIEEAEKSPKTGLRRLKEFYYEVKVKEKRGGEKCRSCRGRFLENLASFISDLESSDFFRQDIQLAPLLRPSFFTSRIFQDPPKNCRLIDSYEVDGARVRIYEKKDELQKYYFLSPPEYTLPPPLVDLLQEARKA